MTEEVWPVVCASCGLDDTEKLERARIRIRRTHTEASWCPGTPVRYQTVDDYRPADIYLCHNCEAVAQQDMETLIATRQKTWKFLFLLGAGFGVISLEASRILVCLTHPFLYYVWIPLFLGLSIMFLMLFLSTRTSITNFKNAGPRRFFFDWTTHGPIRFTNRRLAESYKAANPKEKVRLVKSISRGTVERPELGDCSAFCCTMFFVVVGLIVIMIRDILTW